MADESEYAEYGRPSTMALRYDFYRLLSPALTMNRVDISGPNGADLGFFQPVSLLSSTHLRWSGGPGGSATLLSIKERAGRRQFRILDAEDREIAVLHRLQSFTGRKRYICDRGAWRSSGYDKGMFNSWRHEVSHLDGDWMVNDESAASFRETKTATKRGLELTISSPMDRRILIAIAVVLLLKHRVVA